MRPDAETGAHFGPGQALTSNWSLAPLEIGLHVLLDLASYERSQRLKQAAGFYLVGAAEPRAFPHRPKQKGRRKPGGGDGAPGAKLCFHVFRRFGGAGRLLCHSAWTFGQTHVSLRGRDAARHALPRTRTLNACSYAWAEDSGLTTSPTGGYRGKELPDWCMAEGGWEFEVVERFPDVRGSERSAQRVGGGKDMRVDFSKEKIEQRFRAEGPK
jgi:hypothetical protein